MSFSSNALKHYYMTNFTLLYHHKIDFNVFESCMPWERDLYLNLLTQEVENENLRRQAKNAEERTKTARGRRPGKKRR